MDAPVTFAVVIIFVLIVLAIQICFRQEEEEEEEAVSVMTEMKEEVAMVLQTNPTPLRPSVMTKPS